MKFKNLHILDEIANEFDLIKKYGFDFCKVSKSPYELVMVWYELPITHREIMEYDYVKDKIKIYYNDSLYLTTDNKQEAIDAIKYIIKDIKQKAIDERLNKMKMDFK